MERYIKNNEDIALKVGTQYIIINKYEVLNYEINICSCGIIVEEDYLYVLYKGRTFEDSKKIDIIFDTGDYAIKRLKDAKILKQLMIYYI